MQIKTISNLHLPKRPAFLTLVFSFFLFLANSASAATAGSPLYGSFGANGAGTGGALGAIVDDPSAIFWNPAGMSHLYKEVIGDQNLIDEAEDAFSDENFEDFFENPEKDQKNTLQATEQPTTPFHIEFYNSYDHLTLDRQQFFSSVAFTSLGGVIGIGLISSQVLDIPGYDASGTSIGVLNYQNLAVLTGYAWASGMTRIGVTLNGFQENLGGASIYGGGLNAGVQISPIPIAHLGINIKNLVGVYQLNSSTTSSPVDKLDTMTELSLAFTSPPPSSNVKLMLTFASNLDAPDIAASTETRLGLIFELSKSLYIMGGINHNNLALGFGVNIDFFHMAYAVDQDPLGTGFQHHIELNLAF